MPCSPEDAFAIADMAMLADWNPAVTTSELVSGECFVKGARYRCTVVRGPFKLTAWPVLAEVTRNEFVRYSGKFGFTVSDDSIRFTPDGGGTRLTFENRSEVPRWARPMRFVITRAFHRQANRAIAGAAQYLADRDPESPTGFAGP